MNFWNNKRVFLTGATGLVGSWLAKELTEQGAVVSVLVRDVDPQSEFFRSGCFQHTSIVSGDIENFATVERAINEHEPDTVFHLAAQTIVGVAQRSPLPTFESNIRGSYNVLEACRTHTSFVKRIVVASSDKAYGVSECLPYTEDMPLHGRQPYEVSKVCTDLIAQSYHQSYSLPVTIARCGNIYGGGDLNWSRLIPGTIRSLLQDEAPVLRSDGSFTRDYIYVHDVTKAYMTLAEHTSNPNIQGQAFNFSPEKALTALEMVRMLQNLMGRTALTPVILNNASDEIPSQLLDSSKAHKLLSWQPVYTLEKGLTDTINWYRHFFAQKADASSQNYLSAASSSKHT